MSPCATASARVAGLPHVVAAISDCLDHALLKLWTLPRACEANFMWLLPRLAARRISNGVDPHYWRYQCRRGLVSAVKNENLAMIEWLRAYCPSVLLYQAMIEPGRTGNIRLLDWLTTRHEGVMWLPHIVDAAVSSGQLETPQWLRSQPEIAWGGHLDTAKWVCEQGHESATLPLVGAIDAIKYGHCDIAKYLFEHSEPKNEHFAKGICVAARTGVLELVQWLYARSKSPVSFGFLKPANLAIYDGQFHVVQWLETRFPDELPNFNMIDYAALYGDLELIQQLHASHQQLKCTTRAMDYAAQNGHLSIVQWLYTNQTEGCTTEAMDVAAANGHLDVIKWLHMNRSVGCTDAAMNMAIARGHLEVVKWLHENRTEGCGENAIDLATVGGYLDVVEWLQQNRTELRCTPSAMRLAAISGHFEVLLFLHTTCNEGMAQNAFNYGQACIDHMEIVQWLHENYRDSVDIRALRETDRFMPAVINHILGPDIA